MVEIKDSGFNSWAFTLRKTSTKKGLPMREDYTKHLEKIHDRTGVVIKENVFEMKGGLHMHGVLEIPHAANMKLFRTRGWKLHLEKIWDYEGWKRYFMKEQMIHIYEQDEIPDIPQDIDASEIEDDIIIYRLRKSLFQK